MNTTTQNYYQIGPIGIKTQTLIDLLLQVIDDPLFNNLRTKEQLGYEVSSSCRNNDGILGYTITVNSQEHTVTSDHVNVRIEAFRKDVIDIISELSTEDFERYKTSLGEIKMIKDNHLRDEMTRNWSEIVTDEYLFDRLHRECDYLKTVAQKDLLDFYLTHFNKETRKLSIQVNIIFIVHFNVQKRYIKIYLNFR